MKKAEAITYLSISLGDIFTGSGTKEALRMAIEALEHAPEKGRWLPHFDEGDGERSGDECSVCGGWFMQPFRKSNFCPDCGADMREGADMEGEETA